MKLKERDPQVLWSILQLDLINETTTILWFFSTSGNGNALKYIDLIHQIRRIITVALLHACRRVLLDACGIVRVLEEFVQLLGSKLAL